MNHHSVWDIKVEIFHAYKSNRDKNFITDFRVPPQVFNYLSVIL